MANKHFFFSVIFLFNLFCIAFGADVTFDTSTTVPAGTTYDRVTVTSPAADTVVDYYGDGYTFTTYDNSVLNIHDGAIFIDSGVDPYSFMYDTSTVNLYQGALIGMGTTTMLEIMDSATLNISGGDAVLILSAHQSATTNLYAGSISAGFGLSDNSTLNVYGGLMYGINPDVVSDLDPTATLNFYGYGFVYDAVGDELGVGKLSGFDLSDNAVTYYGIPDPATHSNIHFIPEPATLILFMTGVAMCPRRKR